MKKDLSTLNRLHALKDVFDFLSLESDAVVLRKSDLILQSTAKEDIDLLLSPSVEKRLGSLLKGYGFVKTIDNRLFNSYLYGSKPHVHYISKDLDLHFDIVYSVIHRSLWLESFPGITVTQWIPLHQDIQDEMWRDCSSVDCKNFKIPVLSPLSELLHIVCHIILDKKGIISKYYIERIAHLVLIVNMKELKAYLSKVFYSFSDVIVDQCTSGELKSLYINYIQFKRY